MKQHKKIMLVKPDNNLIDVVKKFNVSNVHYHASISNIVNNETLVYSQQISDVDDKAVRVLICDIPGISDGLSTAFFYASQKNYNKPSATRMISNDYHFLKSRFKEKLSESIVGKDNLLADLNVVAEELLMNAFFDAPIDFFGRYFYKERNRADNVILEGQKVEISFLKDADFSIIHCRDPYGSLDPSAILPHIKRGTAFVRDNIASGRKGAGIGLSLLLFYSDIVIFDVDKNKSSDIFCIRFDRKKSFKIINILNREEDMFNYKLTENGKELTISISGSIDEDANFKNIDTNKFSKIIIDFDGVKGLNSCGIREWINFRGTLDAKELVYKNCRKIVVDQLNIVHGFIKDNVKVESLYLPYFCDACNMEESVSVKLDNIFKDGKITLNAVSCSGCKKPMEFDEIEKQYFNFVKLMKKS